MQLIIVSGLSGAGKSVALKQYEDLGFYCIDNIPLELVTHLALRAIRKVGERYERLAVGVDARESPEEIKKFPKYIDRLRAHGVNTHVVFLHANEQALLHRYAETRRKHPLTNDQTPLIEAIQLEARLLAPIANVADATFDTTSFNLHELREKILERMPGGDGKLSVQLLSFGFKHGTPTDADYVFDVRCLPNPHWEPGIRALNGRDPAIIAWLEQYEDVGKMLSDIWQFLEHWLPVYRKQDRAYVTIAIGCTGGQHRSVYIVDRLADMLRPHYDHLIVKHREIWSATERRKIVKK